MDILHVSATDKTLRKVGKLMLSSAPGSLCAPIHSRPQDLAAKWARRSSHVAKGPKQRRKIYAIPGTQEPHRKTRHNSEFLPAGKWPIYHANLCKAHILSFADSLSLSLLPHSQRRAGNPTYLVRSGPPGHSWFRHVWHAIVHGPAASVTPCLCAAVFTSLPPGELVRLPWCR